MPSIDMGAGRCVRKDNNVILTHGTVERAKQVIGK